MSTPRFSIITITKNHGEGLRYTLASIEEQSCSDYEVIVIDGHSTDDTLKVIKKFRHIVTKFQPEGEPGIYAAMNQAVGLATGEWTIFLNSGDRFFANDVLANVIPRESTDLAFGRAWHRRAHGPAKYNGLDHIWKGQPFCHQALFTRTQRLRERPFDTSLRIAADYKFMVQAYLENLNFEDLDQEICRIEPPGISGQQIWRRLTEKCMVAKEAFPEKPVLLFTLKQGVLEYWHRLRRSMSKMTKRSGAGPQ